MSPDTSTVPWSALLLIGFVVLLVLVLWVSGLRQYRYHVRRRRWQRAQAAEAAASKLLRRLGFDVLGAQVQGSYTLVVDGQPQLVPLRADYLVARNELRYVAEVKSGRLAPKLDHAATRRQLLEYRMAFEVDGVLLVDGEIGRVHEVVFPLHSHSGTRSRLAEFAVAAALLALGWIAACRLWTQ